MLKVEYLIFIDNQNIKSSTTKTFNHLLQSDPDITIVKNKLFYKDFGCEYIIKSGKVKTTEESYFHLSFVGNEMNEVDKFIELLRAVKSVLHLVNKSPQILFDGLSLYFSNLAYPQIFEIENLMRKLITKFMLINVGVDWIKERVPDDVKNSINPSNKDLTYLHNVDFIQLKNFLFSENYTAHKDNLISKLRKAEDINEFKLDEVKALIPISNWEKYFAEKVDITKEQLSKKWDDLYELRCKIAHNRVFGKVEFENVLKLCLDLKDVINKAIENLDKISISETERSILTETIAGNFNHLFGEYFSIFSEFNDLIYELVENKIFRVFPEERPHLTRSVFGDMTRLVDHGLIDDELFKELKSLIVVRNKVVHTPDKVPQEEVLQAIERLKEINKTIKGWL